MDKRKVSQASPAPEESDRARKRRKQSVQRNGGDATANVLTQGRSLFNAVWNHQERKREIRQHFEELPDKADYPDYYQKIKNPISLQEVEAKLTAKQYPALADLASDLLLMCQNAATYNKPKSQVHSDSMRLRSVVQDWMARHALQQQKQQQQPTKSVRREAATKPAPAAPTSNRGSKTSPAALQNAQAHIIDDMLKLVDENGETVATYFISLPSKKLYGDYFRIIKQPISLKMIQKNVQRGDYSNWMEFEHAVGLIRKNAEEYNNEDSGVVKDARRLEEYFQKRLREEKSKLGDLGNSSGIKLRLNVGGHHAQTAPQQQPQQQQHTGPKIKLNVRSRANVTKESSPAVRNATPQPPPQHRQSAETNTPTVNGHSQKAPVPSAAKTRATQQPAINSASNSATVTLPNVTSKNTPTPPIAATPAVQQSAVPAMTMTRSHSKNSNSPPRNRTGSPPSDSITLRTKSMSRTPQPGSTNMSPSASSMSMPPPVHRLSATPGAGTPGPTSRSPAPPFNQTMSAPVPAPIYRQPQLSEEPRFRTEGKDSSSALMTNLRIGLIANSNTDPTYVHDMSPHDSTVTVQYFLHLEPEYQSITATPTISPALNNRNFKLTFEHKINNSPWRKIESMKGTRSEPVFEVRLSPGVVNTLECTIVTAAPGHTGGPGTQWELERFRVFVNVSPVA